MAELRAVAQPSTVLGRRNSEHWAGALYLRKGSIYLTRLLLPTGITANAVTWIMIIIGILGALVLMLPGWWPFLACAVLIQLHIMVDCTDGEIARWRDQSSVSGIYIDRVGHYVVEPLLPICLGIHLSHGISPVEDLEWVILGLLVGVLVLWKKAFGDLVHVARNTYGWSKMSEDQELAAPRSSGLASARSLLRFFPFFRAFGAIEFSLLTLVAALVDLVLQLAGLEMPGPLPVLDGANPPLDYEIALRVWLIACLPLAVLTAGGYLLAILMSSRLRRP
jgi:phosphatidylglycerophosphate synthase